MISLGTFRQLNYIVSVHNINIHGIRRVICSCINSCYSYQCQTGETVSLLLFYLIRKISHQKVPSSIEAISVLSDTDVNRQ